MDLKVSSSKGIESYGDQNVISTSAQSPEPSLRESKILAMLGQNLDQNMRLPKKLEYEDKIMN